MDQRFKDKFQFKINNSENVDIEKFKIPPLLLQPYVENSIWHGLMNKETPGKIKIEVKGLEKQILFIIEDDGATAYTESVVTDDFSFDGALSVAFAAGSEVAAKIEHTGDNIDDVTLTVYFEEV